MGTYAQAYKEVYEILKYISPNYYNKIPKDILFKIKNNMDINYEPDVENNVWSDKTKAILYNIFKDYLATPEQVQIIVRNEFLERQAIEKEKSEKYSPNVFGNGENIENNNQSISEDRIDSNEKSLSADMQLTTKDNKESFFQKIISKIKNILGGKK